MERVAAGAGRGCWVAGMVVLLGGCTTVDPVNVAGGVFFNQLCAQSHVVYQVPAGKLLIIEDASAEAFDAASASIPGNPGIVDNVFTALSLRTNPTGTVRLRQRRPCHRGRPRPAARRRPDLQAYAAPGTEVVYQIAGCTVPVNTRVWFSGRLIDFP